MDQHKCTYQGRLEHSIGVGKADTKIVAKWVADTNGVFVDNDSGEPAVVEDREAVKPRKCINATRRTFAQALKQNFEIDSVFDLYKLSPLGAAYTAGQAIADTGEVIIEDK